MLEMKNIVVKRNSTFFTASVNTTKKSISDPEDQSTEITHVEIQREKLEKTEKNTQDNIKQSNITVIPEGRQGEWELIYFIYLKKFIKS